MSKRSFEETSKGTASVPQILEHVDEILRAAQALKHHLEVFREGQAPDEDIRAILSNHNKKINSATQSLIQDEANAPDQHETGSHKARKLDCPSKPSGDVPTALSIPHPTSLTRWTPQDISDSSLPPLPPVLDPVLEQAALTHSGMTAKPTDLNYERLEWIGDAYIYLMSSAFIFQTFPNLPTGRCSQLRERIVKNENLSDYTVKYGINKRTRFPVEFGLHSETGGYPASQKAKTKVLGDVFESYVAAAIMGDSDGLSRVSAWLKSLWSITLSQEIRKQYRTQSNQAHYYTKVEGSGADQKPVQQELNPKVALSQAVGTRGVNISYNDVGEVKKEKHSGLPWYTVGVFLDGLGESNLQLGIGSAFSKKEAGANAALQALGHTKLMKRLKKKKEAAQAAASSSINQEYDNWS
ncbi:ribonuclease III [Xylariaceae sp. FL0662B]|nr:ribonuclease III [Xylariaceae sp. FL0662B]